MSIRNLSALFRPESIAIIGASTRAGSVGNVLMRNLLAGGFQGVILPVNPKSVSVQGVLAYPDVKELPLTPDLAIIATPPETVPGIISHLGARGTRAAVVITAGFREGGEEAGKRLEQEMLDAARAHCLRIIGPNCVGIAVPEIGLNASFAHLQPQKGKLAFVSQSGAMCTAILDYVRDRSIGFSHFVSLGNSADVDFGDMLDYLALDEGTDAILLYIESIKEAPKFMAAARAAVRNKPVIAIKSGRNQAGAKAASSHTGALVGADNVYDVALKRAGILRVYTMEELFDAVETLARVKKQAWNHISTEKPDWKNRLTIVSNGGGPGVLATDALIEEGGVLAELSSATLASLNRALPVTWSHANPVDIIGDASPERYLNALKPVLADEDSDAVLIMNCPTAIADNIAVAEQVARFVTAETANGMQKVILTNWLGEASACKAREIFARASIPTYATPETAVRAFMHIARYRYNLATVLQTGTAILPDLPRNRNLALDFIASAQADGREMLSEAEAKRLLAAYGIPIVETVEVATVEEAVQQAQRMGYPVALKIWSPDISHKSDVGGVALNLEDEASLRQAAEAMHKRVAASQPEATILGFTVQPMIRMKHGFELIAGISTDPQFGPVLMFGEGGTAVEVINDKALELPPLTPILAEQMIASTRIYQRLKGYRDRAPANLQAIQHLLLCLSQLVADCPQIAELDINPLLADAERVIALDARVRLRHPDEQSAPHWVIPAYPADLQREVTLRDGLRLQLRPVLPQDAEWIGHFFHRESASGYWYNKEFHPFAGSQAARFSQVDYDRVMVFVARTEPAREETGGVLVALSNPEGSLTEFTLMMESKAPAEVAEQLLSLFEIFCKARGTALATGMLPFNGKTAADALKRAQYHSLPQATAVAGGITVPLWQKELFQRKETAA
jgi:acetyltransferase